MSIKTEVIDGEKVKRSRYPLLKTTGTGMIVEFTAPSPGIVRVATSYSWAKDFKSSSWAEENFHYFTGKIILSNE